ncbi:XRE family transcriptional regulator [Pelagibacterium lentulum]|uniref:HTH cro/C1-type domain-containing protein n=1 Tax=Pelagibacterium lentulum TaxID=2029865 RepID=A0A916W440_9HYPH|nr:XRE family transcriptional regulator [Pelagibacterium lentulum]GGA64655.1 hypothetical protein GCM10011499_38900 [Pelagibacterium lentulum]
MSKIGDSLVGARVTELREALGLSQTELARRIGATQQSIDMMERGKVKRPTKLHELARALRTDADYLLGASSARDVTYSSDDPSAPEPIDPDWDGKSAALIDGVVRFNGALPGSVPEIPSSPGMGQGRYENAIQAQIETNGIATGHPVVNEWVIPANYVRSGLDALPQGIVIMGVVGHSMEPLLASGDRVVVDTSQNTWVGDAVYVIDDGDTVFQAKTLKKVPSTNPARFRIVSEADKGDEAVLSLDEFRIIGRVVARISRM